MSPKIFKFKAIVWIYPGKAGWHFVTIPKKQSEEISHLFGRLKKGWGSLPVKVSLRKTYWTTSIFPHKKSKGYLLPIKKEIRQKEKISASESLSFTIEILLSLD